MERFSNFAALTATAPECAGCTDYDRRHLALYAALLDDADAGVDWRETAASLMKLDPAAPDTEGCWRSHLERARWIIGEGLAACLQAFESGAGAGARNAST